MVELVLVILLIWVTTKETQQTQNSMWIAHQAYTVWQNQASNNKTYDIFFKRSIDGGASFGDTINLSNDTGDSTDPDIASSNDGSVYIVWTDNYKGRSKVFFRVIGWLFARIDSIFIIIYGHLHHFMLNNRRKIGGGGGGCLGTKE